jgi:large subunit ribosomal protein L37Ae
MVSKIGSAGRYGARYGKRLKTKVSNIEKVQRSSQKCPYCSRLTVKRVAAGIFSCKKCNAKFTGKAYMVGEQ